MKNRHHIAIVGAGIAGCACAIALKRQTPSLRIVLLDIKSADELLSSPDDTVQKPIIGETLPAQVVLPLQRLGLWNMFTAMNHSPSSGTLSIWGNDRPHANESIFSPFGNAWHINRREFNQAILRVAVSLGVTLMAGWQLRSITDTTADGRRQSDAPPLGGWLLKLRTGQAGAETQRQLKTRFIIDASGRVACAAKMLGMRKHRHDTLMGIYRYYAPKNGQHPVDRVSAHPEQFEQRVADSTTLIESVPQGWWYSASLPGGHRVVSLMTDADKIKRRKRRLNDYFDRAIRESQLIYPGCKDLAPVSDCAIAAACTQNLSEISGRGWLAVGDAAFTFDPLSSLGIFKALRMSTLASYAVQDFFNGKDRELKKFRWLGSREFDGYLEKRRDYYSQENRFADQDFWRRRRAA